MGLANYITFIRIFVSPIFLLLYISHEALNISKTLLPCILLVLLSISELSDVCDGYIARKYNEVSDFGKIFDPMADSIARTSVLLTFTQPPVSLPLPLIFIFLYRDSVISTLRTICALRGFALAARMSGKIKAVVQGVSSFAILALMLLQATDKISLEQLQNFSMYIVAAAAIYTLMSGVDYIYANRKYVSKLLSMREKHEKRSV